MTDLRLSPGSRLGPYKIIRLIARGGMGEVYEAREELLHRNVALKVMTDEAVQHIHQGIELFIKEGKALAQLNHPHVVTIYQLGYDKGIHYIAMEYVEGPNLEEFAEKFNPTPDELVSIFHKVLLGVRALHRKGIIHRDLKPKNIVVQDVKKIKIVDFGVAYIVQDQKPHLQDNSLMGSSHYMSPEVAQGKAPSFQSDIWSLGIIFYQLLTKELPFSGSDQLEILKKVREEEVSFAALDSFLVPQKLIEMVRKMCNKKLNERFQTVDEILLYLEENHAPSIAGNLSRRTSMFAMAGIALVVAAVSVFTLQKKKLFISRPNVVTESAQPAAQAPAKNLSREFAAENQKPVLALPVSKSEVQESKESENSEINPAKDSPTGVGQVGSESAQITADPAARGADTSARVIAEPAAQVNPVSATKITTRESTNTKPFANLRQIAKALPQVRLKSANVQIVLNAKTSGRGPASVTNPPLLNWNKVQAADNYQLQISDDPGFSNLIFTRTVRNTQFKWDSARPGLFYWRIKAAAKNRPAGEFSSVGTIKTSLPKPLFTKSVFKFNVSNSKVLPVTIDWQSNPLANSYRVILAPERNQNATIKNEIVSENKYKFNGKPGVYSVKIMALNNQREPASQTATATIDIEQLAKLPTPEILQPMNGISVPSQGTMITPVACGWTSSKGATAYEFQLSSSPSFKKIEHETRATGPRYVITIPLSIGKYYWRVRAIKEDENQSAWSKSRTFTIN